MDKDAVAVVDFKPFLDGSNKQDVANKILDAFKSIGFVYLANHGIPQSEIDDMFRWSKRLFDLPMEIKQLAPHPGSAHHRGYSAPGRENVRKRTHAGGDDDVDSVKVQDFKENFESGSEHNTEQPNIWYPEDVFPGFKAACLHFYSILEQMQQEVFKALALAFNLSDDYFQKYHSLSQHQLRLLHYPSLPASSLDHKDASRIQAHSDYGSITLLFQDDIGGLEVEDANHPGTFMPVPPIPDALLVNAGDFLMRWSNDIIKSTVHRVRAPLSVDTPNGMMVPARYSIPFFCGPDSHTVIDCIPGTWSESRPKRYEPIAPGEYIYSRIAQNYK